MRPMRSFSRVRSAHAFYPLAAAPGQPSSLAHCGPLHRIAGGGSGGLKNRLRTAEGTATTPRAVLVTCGRLWPRLNGAWRRCVARRSSWCGRGRAVGAVPAVDQRAGHRGNQRAADLERTGAAWRRTMTVRQWVASSGLDPAQSAVWNQPAQTVANQPGRQSPPSAEQAL